MINTRDTLARVWLCGVLQWARWAERNHPDPMPRVNDTPLTPEQAERAAGSVPFAVHVVREHVRLWRGVLDFEHAVSAAFYGLVLAARSYDESRGLWPTHAARWVKGELRDEAGRWRRRGFASRNGGHGGGAGPPPRPIADADAAVSITPAVTCEPWLYAAINEEV